MAGTKEGGIKTAEMNKYKYGPDYYSKIGSKGGKVKSPLKGFGGNRELARKAGRKGGSVTKADRGVK